MDTHKQIAFMLDFNMDNAAFDDSPTGEAARILRDVASKLVAGTLEGRVRDINGNTIGSFAIEEND